VDSVVLGAPTSRKDTPHKGSLRTIDNAVAGSHKIGQNSPSPSSTPAFYLSCIFPNSGEEPEATAIAFLYTLRQGKVDVRE
jgi:hypothetical protein